MAKQCEDCGRRNFDSAVTCVECGSLFPDMVGRLDPDEAGELADDQSNELGPGSVLDASDAPRLQTEATTRSAARSTAPDLAFVRCADCKHVMEIGPQRCKRCGSRRLEQLVMSGASAATRPWAVRQHFRRGRDFATEAEFPTIGLAEVLALAGTAVLKLLVEIPLGVAILLSAEGPGGVGPTTFQWRYPLGSVLLLSATTGAVGAYGLFYLERFGPIVLSTSFALDSILVLWLVIFMLMGEYGFWPGTGPYFFLFLVCVVLSIWVGTFARGNKLGSG
jgi:hypothetical protein